MLAPSFILRHRVRPLGRRLAWVLALVSLAVLLVGSVTSARRYVFCSAMSEVMMAPCCAGHHAAERSDPPEIVAPDRGCCEVRVAPTLGASTAGKGTAAPAMTCTGVPATTFSRASGARAAPACATNRATVRLQKPPDRSRLQVYLC